MRNILLILKDYENQLGSGNVIAATEGIYDDVVAAIHHIECTDTPHLINRAHTELVKAKGDLLFARMYNDPNPSLEADLNTIINDIDRCKSLIDELTTPLTSSSTPNL